MQDGFLGKVSKGIKKRIFDDEPEVVSDSSLIGRLQSLANAESAIQSKKTAEPSPPVTAGDPCRGACYRAGTISRATPRNLFC